MKNCNAVNLSTVISSTTAVQTVLCVVYVVLRRGELEVSLWEMNWAPIGLRERRKPGRH